MIQIRRPGGARFGLLLLFVSLATCWGGGQGTFTALKNSDPTTLSMEEYVRSQPDAKWLELTDAYVDVLEAAHMYTGTDSLAPATRIYVPVFASEEASYTEPPRVVLETTDPELVGLYNSMGGLSEEEFYDWYAENQDRLGSTRTARGMVRFGIELDSDDYDLLRGAFGAHEFILLADGEEPALGFSLFMLLIGFGALFLVVRKVMRSRPDDDGEGEITAVGESLPDEARVAAGG